MLTLKVKMIQSAALDAFRRRHAAVVSRRNHSLDGDPWTQLHDVQQQAVAHYRTTLGMPLEDALRADTVFTHQDPIPQETIDVARPVLEALKILRGHPLQVAVGTLPFVKLIEPIPKVFKTGVPVCVPEPESVTESKANSLPVNVNLRVYCRHHLLPKALLGEFLDALDERNLPLPVNWQEMVLEGSTDVQNATSGPDVIGIPATVAIAPPVVNSGPITFWFDLAGKSIAAPGALDDYVAFHYIGMTTRLSDDAKEALKQRVVEDGRNAQDSFLKIFTEVMQEFQDANQVKVAVSLLLEVPFEFPSNLGGATPFVRANEALDVLPVKF